MQPFGNRLVPLAVTDEASVPQRLYIHAALPSRLMNFLTSTSSIEEAGANVKFSSSYFSPIAY